MCDIFEFIFHRSLSLPPVLALLDPTCSQLSHFTSDNQLISYAALLPHISSFTSYAALPFRLSHPHDTSTIMMWDPICFDLPEWKSSLVTCVKTLARFTFHHCVVHGMASSCYMPTHIFTFHTHTSPCTIFHPHLRRNVVLTFSLFRWSHFTLNTSLPLPSTGWQDTMPMSGLEKKLDVIIRNAAQWP